MHKKYFLSTAINTENTGLRGGSPREARLRLATPPIIFPMPST